MYFYFAMGELGPFLFCLGPAWLSLVLVISLRQCTGACWEFPLEFLKLPFKSVAQVRRIIVQILLKFSSLICLSNTSKRDTEDLGQIVSCQSSVKQTFLFLSCCFLDFRDITCISMENLNFKSYLLMTYVSCSDPHKCIPRN